MMTAQAKFDVHLPNLLREAVECNPGGAILARPAQITQRILAEVAQRAIELDDPELNVLMIELALYDVAFDKRGELIDAQSARKTSI